MVPTKNGPTNSTRRRSRRWFLACVAGLMTFLALALCFEAILLMRRGMQPMVAQVSGNSMEPHLRGPRLLFENSDSRFLSSYTLDSLRPNTPVVCQYTSQSDSTFDLLSAMGVPGAVTEGESVRYFLSKRMAAMRSAERKNGSDRMSEEIHSGLYRGDLVVIQPPEVEDREVKRIVGFPGEIIDIIDGDLWISGRRWRRSLTQIFEQAVLLDYGDGESNSYWNYGQWRNRDSLSRNGLAQLSSSDSSSNLPNKPIQFPKTLAPLSDDSFGDDSSGDDIDIYHSSPRATGDTAIEFRLKSGGLITNELRWNAHDSHMLVPVTDIGLALEIDNEETVWQMAVTIQSPELETIMVERNGGSITVSTAQQEVSKAVLASQHSSWLAFIQCDGELIVADQTSEWLREPNAKRASVDEGSALEMDTVPFAIECHQGELCIKQWAVFRDLHFRGAGDTALQKLEAGKGIVVLGDNVSLSDDSRQRWDDGLSIEAVRGVVDLQLKGWQALLKQKDYKLFESNQALLKKLF